MQLERRKIGLVEDDPIMGESLAQRLTLEGARVHWWRSKAHAVPGVAQEQPDAVICDIRLPDGTGEDIFLETRRQQMRTIFLFMTAYADLDQAVRLMRAGAGDYVAKPFEMRTLLARLHAAFADTGAGSGRDGSLRDARGEAERARIERALIDTGGRIGEAARMLNVSRTTLWQRMKALDIPGRKERSDF